MATMLALPGIAQDQEAPPPPPPVDSPSAVPIIEESTRVNPQGPCLEPPPLMRLEDYQGPFKKTVGFVGRRLERRALDAPDYKPNAILCSLELEDKFFLFVGDTFDPLTFIASGFNAGLSQAQNSDPSFGQGAAGYGKRFGVDFAARASTRFFSEFAYPAIFSEDPRYYRLAKGKFSTRLWHAVGHSVIAYNDDGRHMFNYAEWLGTATGATIDRYYHPGSDGGAGSIARGTAYSILTDIGFDVLREFWPTVARKLHIPFRGVNQPAPNAPR